MQTRILVIRLSSLGDILLTSPFILNLTLHYKNCRVTYVTKESYGAVASALDGVDEVVTIPNNAKLSDYFAILGDLTSRRFDLVFDLHGKPFSWLARNWIPSSGKWVVPKQRMERWLATKGLRQHPQSHTIDLLNSYFELQGMTSYARRPILGDFGSSRHLPREKFVCICPEARHQTKMWPREKFLRLAEMVSTETGYDVVWIEEGKDTISAKLPVSSSTIIHITGKSLQDVASFLGRATAAVTNDSGLMHLASSLYTPVVSIFGPTHPILGFSPRGLHDHVVETDEYCRPCSLHGKTPCFRDKQYCFERIETRQVFDRLCHILNSEVNSSKAVFLDRDGTVIVEKKFLRDPIGVELERGSASALKKLKQLGYKLIIVSNQSGVARGLLTQDDVRAVNARMVELLAAEGVALDDILWCPYFEHGHVSEFAKPSRLRKPSPGMPELAAHKHGIDLRRSWVVGDRLDDVGLGRVIYARPILVMTGYGAETVSLWSSVLKQTGVPIADGLPEAATLIEATR